MSKHIPLSVDLLVSAVRYALGRKTYIVSETARELRRVWNDLPSTVQDVIIRDIRADLELWQRTPEFAPHQCDIEEWQQLLDYAKEVNHDR